MARRRSHYGSIVRRRAEQALRASEERYRKLFEDSPVALWEFDLSDIRRYLDDLREAGVDDYETCFDCNPDAVAKAKVIARPAT